jgi:hypothetical protein
MKIGLLDQRLSFLHTHARASVSPIESVGKPVGGASVMAGLDRIAPPERRRQLGLLYPAFSWRS